MGCPYFGLILISCLHPTNRELMIIDYEHIFRMYLIVFQF
jgi:hypothetical protein